MANEAGLKIVIGSDVSGALAGLNSVSAAAAKAGITTEQSFSGASVAAVTLANALESTTGSFDEVAASSAALARINASIDSAADSAIKGAAAIGRLGNEAEGLSKAAVDFRVFNANAKQLPLQNIDAFKKSVQQLKQELAVLGLKKDLGLTDTSNSANKAATALKGVKGASNEAGLALTNVGRVAQDLPFGFLGIQNNLNPLLESFQRLKTQSGSTGGALKALAGSLVGAGGIGLALSVVSAGILIYQNGIAGFNRKTKEAKQEADAYATSLKGIGDEIGGQAARVGQLVEALDSSNLSLAQRSSALKELKGINDEYFGSLKDEGGIVVGLSAAYDGYISQLEKLGRAKAIQEQISKLFSERLQLELNISPEFLAATSSETQQKLGVLRKRLEELGGAIDFAKQKDTDIFSEGNKSLQERIALQRQITEIEGGVEFFKDANYQKEKKKIDDITLRIQGLQKLSGDLGEFNIKPDSKFGKETKEQDAVLKELTKSLEGYRKKLEDINSLRKDGYIPAYLENQALDAQLAIFDILNAIDAREVTIKAKPKLEIDPVIDELKFRRSIDEYTQRIGSNRVTIAPIINLKPDVQLAIPGNLIPSDAFDAVIEQMQAQGAVAKEKITDIILDLAPAISEAFAGAGEAVGRGIGDLISGFGGENLLKGFANTLADVIDQVGRMLIKAGVQFIALKKLTLAITSAGGAALAIAGGIAAIALAQALRNSVNNVKPRPFATGGLVTAPTIGLIGEAGPEVVLPLDRIPSLLGSGPGANVNVNGEFRMSGRDLVAILRQNNKSFDRIN